MARLSHGRSAVSDRHVRASAGRPPEATADRAADFPGRAGQGPGKRRWSYQRLGYRLLGYLVCLQLGGLQLGCSAGSGPESPSERPEDTEAWRRCTASPIGAAASSVAPIVYQEQLAFLTVEHDQPSGCLVGLTLRLQTFEGCRLDLSAQNLDGAWRPASGSLVVDAGCGSGWPNAQHGAWTLRPEDSSAWLVGFPSAPAAPEWACLDIDGAQVLGRLTFERDGATLEVRLPGIHFEGAARSTSSAAKPDAVRTGTCATEPAMCQGVICGVDELGVSCDSCGPGLSCDGQACVAAVCAVGTPEGMDPGQLLGDIELPDCDGNPVRLRAVCGSKAAYIGWFADWCPTCAKFVAQLNGVYERHAPAGLAGVAILTADAFKNPPTSADCKAWRDEKGLAMTVLFDPTGLTADFGGKETSVLTDTQGVILLRETGTSPLHLESMLAEQLAK